MMETKVTKFIEDGEFVEESRIIVMSPKKDKLLFRKTDHTLSEYSISRSGMTFLRHHTDDKMVITDFCFYHSADKKTANDQVLIMSKQGVLKRIQAGTGAARKFEISQGSTCSQLEGKNFKLAYCNFLSYLLVSFNRQGDSGMQHVAFVVQMLPDEINFVNEVLFDTGIGKLTLLQITTPSSSRHST